MENQFRPEVVYRHPETLTPYSNNTKLHPDAQVEKIAGQIARYGFDQPIVITSDGVIIKGHGRREAAIRLGLQEVPCIVRPDLSEHDTIGARIGDNKVAESPWDESFLQFEFGTLARQGLDVSGMTGFELPEIANILKGWNSDHDRVKNTDGHTDGIRATIKVTCSQEAQAELKRFLTETLQESGFEGVEIA